MVTIEAYRASIGSFCSKAQRHAQFSSVSVLFDTAADEYSNKFTGGHDKTNETCFLKSFCTFLFAVVLYLNVNLELFKLLTLRVDGDIESNPGPSTYDLQKSVQGSFHQGHPKFGETSGIQCACNSLLQCIGLL